MLSTREYLVLPTRESRLMPVPRWARVLTALPDADVLQDYLTALRAAWSQRWCNQPARYPHLLLRLYRCIAFLRYEGNAFWGSFGEAVAYHRIASNPNRQTEINDVLDRISHHVGLEILHGAGRTRLCVQSAVRHVGIPVRISNASRHTVGPWHSTRMAALSGRLNSLELKKEGAKERAKTSF